MLWRVLSGVGGVPTPSSLSERFPPVESRYRVAAIAVSARRAGVLPWSCRDQSEARRIAACGPISWPMPAMSCARLLFPPSRGFIEPLRGTGAQTTRRRATTSFRIMQDQYGANGSPKITTISVAVTPRMRTYVRPTTPIDLRAVLQAGDGDNGPHGARIGSR